jgi:serine/threonine-protein kinase
MVTGQRLFGRDTVSDTLASVLNTEPEWTRVPANVRRLLRSCLQKDPKLRLRDIGDAWRLLEEPPHAGPAHSSVPWKVAAAAAIVIAIVSTLSLLARWRAPHVAGQPLVALNLDLGPDVSLSGAAPAMDLSPDGNRIAFVSQGPDGIRHLFTRRLDQPTATVLAKTDGAFGPFFSPDGRWLGFFANNKLKKIPADGGEPIVLCEAPQARGASWGEDDGIIAALDTRVGLVRVPAAGGTPTVVTPLNVERGEASHRWPQVLPGGKAALFTMSTVGSFFEGADIMAVSLEDHQTKTILKRAGMYGRYLPSGHLTYVSKGTLYAVPFDLDRLVTHGAPVPLLENVFHNPYFGSAQFNFTPGGTFVYRSDEISDRVTIQWLNGAGKTEPLWQEPGFYQTPRVSPDGQLLAIATAEGPDSQIWVYNWARRLSARLTQGAGIYQSPVWYPGGQYVVFNGPGGMFSARADGVGGKWPQSGASCRGVA